MISTIQSISFKFVFAHILFCNEDTLNVSKIIFIWKMSVTKCQAIPQGKIIDTWIVEITVSGSY